MPFRGIRALGPGIITGAADDDPAGIATYSIAGAQFGTGLLWTAPLTWPLIAAVEGMCARVGMVTGTGLMGALRRKLPRPALWLVVSALLFANTFNIGADLAGMADVAALLTGIAAPLWVAVIGVLIAWATIGLHYRTIARVLMWLVLALFAYPITAFLLRPDWTAVLRATFLPRWPQGPEAWATIVAILGTTISPYLFFWQAAEEVEEEKAQGRLTPRARAGATEPEIRARRLDIGMGTLLGNITFFFIILTTALTLHASGLSRPETTTEVAAALEPIAGRHATVLYALGILGTGALAIPVLAGSAAYALSELFGWPEGMDERWTAAPRFYGVFALSIGAAMIMAFAQFSVVRALYLSAVINGLLAPFLLIGVLAVASDRHIMEGQPSPWLARALLGLTIVIMLAAATAMFALPNTG
jgi:NRAMP (natural resistance-associated macrophage protein)-like metal ion transporter